MGRLEDIAQRNKHPWKLRGMLSLGLRSVFLLVILGLLIFTNWAIAPEDNRPGIHVVPAPAVPAPAVPPAVPDKTVEGVKLWSPPKGSTAR